MSANIVQRLAAAGAAAGAGAETSALQQLVARAAEEFAGSDVEVGVTEVGAEDRSLRLRGRGLRVRALGSRHRAPDARFAGLLATLARGE